MSPDLGVNPNRTLVGAVLFVIGLFLETWVFADPASIPILLVYVAPFPLGLGLGMLARQWYDTRRLRREAREWADAHPGEDPTLPEPPPRDPFGARPVPPEDDPNWVAWTQQQMDNPENPTDGSGEKGQ